jgi:hypothetical protein
MLGMFIQSFEKEESSSFIIWVLSPITLPIIIGMMLADSKENNN